MNTEFDLRCAILTWVFFLIFLLFTFFSKAQIFITPNVQLSTFEQSGGGIIGYKHKNYTFGLNYNLGYKYDEKTLYLKYDFTNSEIFNVGLSLKGGLINNVTYIFMPAMEVNYGKFELGLRPSNAGLLILETRFRVFLFKK